ncbi:MAG TPA: spore coat associated protein CotJA [Candidatus Butyricicoccus stercorigallinarum]|nr:spore coat associated protein CotJA [Candidatus Butyricicoccus stercorigallinarum]
MAEEKTNARRAVTTQNEQSGPGFVMNYNLLALAMGFVPDQLWQNIYNDDVALARGTIFADLDKPFIGEEAVHCD